VSRAATVASVQGHRSVPAECACEWEARFRIRRGLWCVAVASLRCPIREHRKQAALDALRAEAAATAEAGRIR
jgi:hypothetical protein